ncbi:hypothetical protein KQI63_05965 [bacterium]|nr:hypothetical protein [bacterium]
MPSITEAIRETIHGYDKGIKQLAALLNVPYNYLAKAANTNDPGPLNIQYVPGLIELTGNDAITTALAAIHNQVVIQIPQHRASSKELADLVLGLQHRHLQLVKAALDFSNDHSDKNHERLKKEVRKYIRDLVQFDRTADVRNQRVMDL